MTKELVFVINTKLMIIKELYKGQKLLSRNYKELRAFTESLGISGR